MTLEAGGWAVGQGMCGRAKKGPQGVWDKYLFSASCVPSAGTRVANDPRCAALRDLTLGRELNSWAGVRRFRKERGRGGAWGRGWARPGLREGGFQGQ